MRQTHGYPHPVEKSFTNEKLDIVLGLLARHSVDTKWLMSTQDVDIVENRCNTVKAISEH